MKTIIASALLLFGTMILALAVQGVHSENVERENTILKAKLEERDRLIKVLKCPEWYMDHGVIKWVKYER